MAEQLDDPWQQIEEKEFASFDEQVNQNVLYLIFLDNAFTPKKNPQYGNIQYEFQVMELIEMGKIKTFSPSSNRLMVELKKHIPLLDKAFKITRIGEGFGTKYDVVLLTKEQSDIIKAQVPGVSV